MSYRFRANTADFIDGQRPRIRLSDKNRTRRMFPPGGSEVRGQESPGRKTVCSTFFSIFDKTMPSERDIRFHLPRVVFEFVVVHL